MTDRPYTDADVKLVEQAILHADPPIRRGYINGPDVLTAEARSALDALAAAGRLAPVDDDPRHIIEFRPGSWTIKHPLSCRTGDLFGCRVNLAAEDLDGPPVPPGRYEASVSDIDGQLLIGDRVDQEPPPPADDPADAEADQVAVQNLLDDATRAFADAGTSSERVEVIRDLLAGWYAAWPATAVTDEHEGIAHQLVALVWAAEARASEPPSWVLELVRGLSRYEMEHPTLYRQNGDGTYSRWPCPEPLLELVPAEVRRRAGRTEQVPRSETGCMGDPDAELRLAGVHPDQDPVAAQQALRDRVEHAIRSRLGKAWPTLDDGQVFLDQVAAVAAVAAVEALTESEG